MLLFMLPEVSSRRKTVVTLVISGKTSGAKSHACRGGAKVTTLARGCVRDCKAGRFVYNTFPVIFSASWPLRGRTRWLIQSFETFLSSSPQTWGMKSKEIHGRKREMSEELGGQQLLFGAALTA